MPERLFTRAEILAELARELGVRRNVYPRWIQDGRITDTLAKKRIDALQEAYDFLMEKLPREPDFFR